MTGTESQVEWAARIRRTVELEFDRIRHVLQDASSRQTGKDVEDTTAILEILEQLRREVLAHDEAGYFVRNWQELRDQVRQMLMEHPQFQAIQLERRTRRGGATHVI